MDCITSFGLMQTDSRGAVSSLSACQERGCLFTVVDAFYTWGYPGEYFVGDCIEGPGYPGNRDAVAEYFHPVTTCGICVGDVYHTYVHTDISYGGAFHAVDHHRCVSVAEMAV